MSSGETIVICQICEHENDPDQRFCDECGVELHPADEEVSQTPSSPSLPTDTVMTTEDEVIATLTPKISAEAFEAAEAEAASEAVPVAGAPAEEATEEPAAE